MRLLEQNDRVGMVRLLSVKCPRFVSDLPLELFLVINMKDGILVLFDSFESANEDSGKLFRRPLIARLENCKEGTALTLFWKRARSGMSGIEMRSRITILISHTVPTPPIACFSCSRIEFVF